MKWLASMVCSFHWERQFVHDMAQRMIEEDPIFAFSLSIQRQSATFLSLIARTASLRVQQKQTWLSLNGMSPPGQEASSR
jgi:hypothetical protein